MVKKIGLLISFFLVLMAGCVKEDENLSAKGEIAKSHLEELGYKILSFESEDVLRFSKAQLEVLPYKAMWEVQSVSPDKYIYKNIDTVDFIVRNHPLDDLFDMGKTRVTVFIYNDEVIGGLSSPTSKYNDVVGGWYSIDGKNP
ncbi:hypothetical protein ACIQXF_06185 [Lysinibacillus sp. NPDC097231]|uniref:hypothetical protein n=1 Tax=Lysinibacillus sp. NPDC097231 TaxID=3364142 RepID=UPI003822C235